MSIETFGTLLIVVGVILGMALIIRIVITRSDEGINGAARESPARKGPPRRANP